MTEQERIYRETPALHYSLLSKVDQDVRRVIQEQDASKYQNFGSIADKLLFERDDFFNEFYIIDFINPSDNIKAIVDDIWENVKDEEDPGTLENYNMAIFDKAKEINWGQSWKPETLLDKVIKQGKEYFEKLKTTQHLILITQEEYAEADRIVEMLKHHLFTEHLFVPMDKNDSIERLYQAPFYAEIDGYQYKALLDYVVINHEDKVITPIDLKIMGQDKFTYDFKYYRYYLQAALYSDVLQYNYPDYKIENFQFLIARRSNISNPLRYTCTDVDLAVGAFGGHYRRQPVKGYKQLTKEYIWHKQHDKWGDAKEIYDSEGVITLGVFDEEYKYSA